MIIFDTESLKIKVELWTFLYCEKIDTMYKTKDLHLYNIHSSSFSTLLRRKNMLYLT